MLWDAVMIQNFRENINFEQFDWLKKFDTTYYYHPIY